MGLQGGAADGLGKRVPRVVKSFGGAREAFGATPVRLFRRAALLGEDVEQSLLRLVGGVQAREAGFK